MNLPALKHETPSQPKEKSKAHSRFIFLSKDWVHKIVQAIEKAKAEDKDFRSLTYDFSLSIAYIITELPESLSRRYGRDEIAIFIELEEGFLRKLIVDAEIPADRSVDFTIKSSYDVAKKIFLGELKPATAFIKRKVKVKPFMKLYRDPAFTAKSIITINAILKIIKEVPTVFPE
jgi:putative sterol carrier protein